MGLLAFLGFIAVILGPLAFFMSLGVRPRLRDLEEAREKANPELWREVADI